MAIDKIHFGIGSRIYLAAEDFIRQGEHDLASVLLVTAVDASLGYGIVGLSNWRNLQIGLGPPDPVRIETDIAKMKWRQKLRAFEKLAGATMRVEIDRLKVEDRLPSGPSISFRRILRSFNAIRLERNKLVHRGESVGAQAINENYCMIHVAIFVLESLYHAAFDMRKDTPSVALGDQVLEKWRRWLKGIFRDVRDLKAKIYVYEALAEIVHANQTIQKPSLFYDVLRAIYNESVVMNIRRQVKPRERGSLAGLLCDIIKMPEVLTLEAVVPATMPERMRRQDEDDLSPDFTDGSPRHIRPEIVEADYESLRKVAESIEYFADNAVAHLGKSKLKRLPPTYVDVAKCAEVTESIVLKYDRLLERRLTSQLGPKPDKRWKDIFRHAWIPETHP